MDNQDCNQSHSSRTATNTDRAEPSSQTLASVRSNQSPFSRQRSEESWIEVESRPSSSSLSSAADEIITPGLRVQHDSNGRRRRRRSLGTRQFHLGQRHHSTGTGGGSSQEEYEESESESDRVMTSSTEGIGPSVVLQQTRRSPRNLNAVSSSETMSERKGDGEDDDDDENATAVNYPRSSPWSFEPRPNAFSHPSGAHAAGSQPGQGSSTRRSAAHPSSQRHSYPQHSPYNVVSPSYQADHDEALRASLSTLLSAAAAVRGLPKPTQPRLAPSRAASGRVDPATLRLVPESVVLGEEGESVGKTDPTTSYSSSPRATSTSSRSDKSKRKTTIPGTYRSGSKERHAVKKARRTAPLVDEVSPTLLTWVVSAGVVVLVSAITFSAGYVVGREAGHAEAVGQLGGLSTDAGRCSKEAASEVGRAGMSLRRLRWSGGSGVRV